jgi:hypothetical protein
MIKGHIRRYVLLAALLGCALPASAQTTGSVSGTIKDNSGAVVPGVAVTIENIETNATRSTSTDSSGTYALALLPPGRYRIKAELQGFRTEERNDFTLQVSQNARVDFSMNLGSIEESVMVQGAAPLVDTRDAAMGQVVEQAKIVELPLNGRNFRDLGLIAPGVQQQTQASGLATRGGGLYINGARIYDNNYLLDGFDNNDTTTGEILTFPSPDAIQEFKVLGASYGAEYGFASGGIISLISRSGGASYRGNLFGFVRNDAMDAKNYFATSTPKLDRRQGGGTIGGPILSNKLFFFGSYEKTALVQGQPFTSAVPSDLQRQGNFGSSPVRDPLTGQPFPNNVIPASRFNPTAVAMLPLYPEANNPADPTRNYVSSPDLLDDLHVASGKVDFNQSPSNTYSARYSLYWDTQSTPGALPAVVTAVRKHNQQVGFTWTHVYGSRTVQEVRGGVGHIYNGMFRDDSTAVDWGANLGIGGTLQQAVPNRLGLGPPVVNLTGFSSVNPNNNPFIRTHNLRQLSYVLAQSYGSHSIKAGGEARTQQMALDDWRNPQGTFTFTGRYTGQAVGDFLLGYPSQTTTFVGLVFMEQVNWQTAAFVQDEWRVSPSVTLNYGLRYEYQAPDREVENRWGTFAPELGQSVQVGTNGVPETMRSADKTNFAPRVGMVWDVSGDASRALRAGYGIYYTSFVHNIAFSSYANTPLGSNKVFAASPTTPNISLSDPFPTSFGSDTVTTSGMERQFPQGKVHRWSLDLQQELPGGSMLSLGYVGSRSVDLTRQYNINQPVLGPGTVASRRPYPSLGDITWTDGTGTASYNSMEAKYQRRLNRGLDLLVSYTLSKAIDDGVVSDDAGSGVLNSYNRDAERGLSAWDRRHRFVTSGSYSVPFTNAVARDWQLSAIFTLTSGSPFTPVISSDVAGIGNLGNQRPNLTGDPSLSGDERSPNRWFNTAAFAVPETGTFGNAGRNILTGPGVNTLDTALSRRFSLPRDSSLQVRFEMFNVLNHANFLLPNRTVDSPQFGTISGAGPARQGQIGVKFAW